jgi:ribonuclease HII
MSVDEQKTLTEAHKLLRPECESWKEGFCFVAGVDEVGRGPLAGPVVAAAVRFPRGIPLPWVFDSKQVTEEGRKVMREAILAVPGVDWAIGEASVEEIDSINILNATHLAMRRAVEQLNQVDFILVDGRPVKGLPFPSRAIVKGDAKSASIAAASILAKVSRDRYITELSEKYPEYSFEKHKGYATKAHMDAIRAHGPCEIHRPSFLKKI